MQESHAVYIAKGTDRVWNTNNTKIHMPLIIHGLLVSVVSQLRVCDSELLVQKVHFQDQTIGTSIVTFAYKTASYSHFSYILSSQRGHAIVINF